MITRKIKDKPRPNARMSTTLRNSFYSTAPKALGQPFDAIRGKTGSADGGMRRMEEGRHREIGSAPCRR
jgi:hypothetical protein